MPTGRLVLASVCSICVAATAASVGAAWQTAAPASTPPGYPGYSLVWADEFDRPGEPDPKRWYLLLNLAVGGTQGGDPSKTAFPGRFEVDYVRVYQAR